MGYTNEPWAGYYTVGNWPSNDSKKKLQKTKKINNLKKDYSFMVGGIRQRTPEEQKKWEKEVQRQKELIYIHDPRISSNSPIVSGNTEKPYYLKAFQSRMNQDLKSRDDVKAFQKKLIDLYGTNAVGKYGADGTWGADTQAAYDRYLADQKRKQLAENLQLQTIKIVPQETPTLIAPTIPQVNNNIRTGNYNRSQIRDLIRSLGYDPYSFSGSERKALRRYLNGESNDTSKLVGNLAQFIEGYKKGGLIRKGQKGLPTAPKAEDRYSNSYISWNWPNYKEVTANSKLFPGGAKISQTIEGIDTIYTETPPRFPFVKVIPRTAKNNAKTIQWRDLITGQTYPEVKRGNSLEYETLKRRFNTAWNLAKNKY